MKIFQLHSLVPGVRFYRMTSPAKYLSSEHHHEIYFENTSLEGLEQSDWQKRALDKHFHEMLQQVLKGIDLLVTQLVHWDGAIAVLQGIKEVFGIPIVLDLDDNVENVPYYNQGAAAYRPNTNLSTVTMDMFKEVDAVTVTTEYLARQMKKYNDNIHVLPNSIDLDLWDTPLEIPSKKSIRIGWMGAETHEDDIKMILPAIKEVLRKYRHVKFYFIGGVPACVRNYKHKRCISSPRWYDILEYPNRMRQWRFDIGIAPLRDNAFNRAKSNLRWLEMSAMGIPTVASRVEPFKKSITDGKTGLLAYEPDEWVEQLSRLVEDEALRQKIGNAARKRIELSYNMKKNARKWSDVYETVIEKAKVTAK